MHVPLSPVAAVFAALSLLYATLVEPHWLEVTRLRLKTGSRTPLVIAQLSDLHLGRPGALEERIIETLHDQPPDVIVLSGDVVDREEGLTHLPALLARLPEVPRFAVLGNWEYWSGIDLGKLRRVYRAGGVTLLVNESHSLVVGGQVLRITGLDDDTAGTPRLPDSETARAGDARLLVQHSPGYFESTDVGPAGKFDLCVSGHTHGGQVTLFGIPLWLPPGSGGFVHGLHDRTMCPVYVSRGLGTSLLPLRLGARPEIVFFEL